MSEEEQLAACQFEAESRTKDKVNEIYSAIQSELGKHISNCTVEEQLSLVVTMLASIMVRQDMMDEIYMPRDTNC